MTIQKIIEMKSKGKKISMVTCYDFTMAQIVNRSEVDLILVGDSAAMVMHGQKTTLNISTELMCVHTRAVVRGAPDKFIIADMPFMSYRKSLSSNMRAVEKLMKAGAHAIKLEGAKGNLELVRHIVESGVPVMGHLGLTPQSIFQLGGFKVQGREQKAQDEIFNDAKALEQAGVFSVVLECVPNGLAQKISSALSVPTIGIGAGVDTDGQVLVLQDMLGLNTEFKPKFLKHYLNGAEIIQQSLNKYDQEVKSKQFPDKEHSYDT